MKTQIKEMIASIAHLKSIKDFLINSLITLLSFLFAYGKVLIFDNINLFIAIGIVVIVDWLFGVAIAVKKKKFETQKALKIIYYLVTYWSMLFAVLAIEKGFPSAFWLTEAIIMPILVFQLISMIKNLILLGVVNNTLAKQIFKNIDRYKEQVTENIKDEES